MRNFLVKGGAIMTLSAEFNLRATRDRKTQKELNTFEDFRTARIRQADGSYSHFKGGKLIAKEDAPQNSKFHAPTPVVTIVAELKKEEAVNRVEKRFDVN